MRDLRSEGHRGEEAEQATEVSVCGSQPSNGGNPGNPLPSVQLRNRSLSGQPRSALEGSGISEQLQLVIWCNLNDKQRALESGLRGHGISVSSIYGSLSPEEVEARLYEWKDKKTQVLLGKPSMLGSGTNLQQAHIAIYVGLDFKFRDFIQSIHRLQRYGQTYTVQIHCIHTDAEDSVVNILTGKWRQHDEMVARMRAIVQEYGLTNEALVGEMQRTLGVTRQEQRGEYYTAINNDCTLEAMAMADNSVDEIISVSLSAIIMNTLHSLNDFGHNPTDSDFWVQMDFLIPELLRVKAWAHGLYPLQRSPALRPSDATRHDGSGLLHPRLRSRLSQTRLCLLRRNLHPDRRCPREQFHKPSRLV